jgi:hypothetical protein
MTKFLLIPTLTAAAVAALAVAPTASAHFQATCGGETVTLHTPGPFELQVIEGTRVVATIIETSVTVDGVVTDNPQFANPGIPQSALNDQLVTCTFMLGGSTYEVTGVLTPARP